MNSNNKNKLKMLLEVCLIVYILYASMLLLTTPDKLNNWILAILLAYFILLILFVSFFIKERQEEGDDKVNSEGDLDQVKNQLNQQQELNEMENYLCKYSDNPQCYNKDSKSCDGYGIQGRPFEFEYTPQTDINWNWAR